MIVCDHCGEPRPESTEFCQRCGRIRGHWEPSETAIRVECLRIQATWTESVERSRRMYVIPNVETPRIGVQRCHRGAHGISPTYCEH